METAGQNRVLEKAQQGVVSAAILLLSSPSTSESSRIGKRLWVKKYMPSTKLILAYKWIKYYLIALWLEFIIFRSRSEYEQCIV
jgi:hypothetical protein